MHFHSKSKCLANPKKQNYRIFELYEIYTYPLCVQTRISPTFTDIIFFNCPYLFDAAKKMNIKHILINSPANSKNAFLKLVLGYARSIKTVSTSSRRLVIRKTPKFGVSLSF